MKKLFLFVFSLVLAVLSYAQLPVKPNQPYAKTVDVNSVFSTKAGSDTLYLKVTDAIVATDYFYTKQQTQALPVNTQLVVGLQSYGSTVKALPFGVTMSDLFATTTTLLDAVYYTALFEVKDTITATGVGWVQQTQGAYTADGYNGVAIYTVSGGTETKLVETVNDGNIWKVTAFALGTKAFAAPQVLLPGLYKVSALWNASATTTSPVIYSHTAVSSNITLLLPNSEKVSGSLVGQSSMPSSVAGSALTSTANYLGIYLY